MASVWATSAFVHRAGKRPTTSRRVAVQRLVSIGLLVVFMAGCLAALSWSWPRAGDGTVLASAVASGGTRSVQPGHVQRIGPWWRLEADPLADTVVWQDRWWRTRTVPRDTALNRTLQLPHRSPADDDYVLHRLLELRADGIRGPGPELALLAGSVVLLTSRLRPRDDHEVSRRTRRWRRGEPRDHRGAGASPARTR